MLEAEPAVVRHQEKLPETRDGAWDLLQERVALLLDLEEGLAGEAAEEDALHRVLEDFEDVRELEDERTRLVAREAEAAHEGFEARDWERLVGLGEDDALEFEDLARFFLHFHVVVVAVVANPKLLFGDCGGLGEFSVEVEIGVVWEILEIALEEIEGSRSEDSHFGV